MNRYVCIHGHFYQPPRENPWLETIEPQESAYPYHDWNERIAAECFGPNARCRILDSQDRIVKIVNNYSHISFNFGPTLLSWLEHNSREIYQSILEADQESALRFSGHGSAIAQAYNHVILPLATRRQKEIQVRWGIRDFEKRFGRFPEGLWLPETAVDLETLEVLADQGIAFTILAPHQARRVRRIGSKEWIDVPAGSIDTSRAYRVALPSGASLDLFFYDGSTSRAVAFEGLLRNGETFANRLVSGFSSANADAQLSHIATDGETYGHHHRFGEMALAYALDFIQSNGLARLTNYGEFLERHPPAWEVKILENTSWSCAHGIGRWSDDCGCRTGFHPDWHQAWRAPLRKALDWLAETVEPKAVGLGSQFFREPSQAFEEYIDVVMDRSRDNVETYFRRHAQDLLRPEDRVAGLKLLELQRFAQLMYTSCAWFFDELSGIEATQIIQYAGRVAQLAEELFGEPLQPALQEKLAQAPSNLPEHRDGGVIYQKWVRPAAVDLLKVGAHYALSSLFEDYGETTAICCYDIHSQDFQTFPTGRGKVAVGRAEVVSAITWESRQLTFAVFHLGDHVLNGGVRVFRSEEAYEDLKGEAEGLAERVDFAGMIRLLDRHFDGGVYALDSLFRDEQRKILKIILDANVAEVETAMQAIYERQVPLMRYLENLRVPLPSALETMAQFFINRSFRRVLSADELDLAQIQNLLKETGKRRVHLDRARLSYEFENALARMAGKAFADPSDLLRLQRVEALVDLAKSFPFEVNFWQVQYLYYRRLQELAASGAEPPSPVAAVDAQWRAHFLALGEKLRVHVDSSLRSSVSPSS